MDQTLADRIRALPEAVRAKLATVAGPGWALAPDGTPYLHAAPKLADVAWWPADYPAAIAAVKGWDLSTTFEALEVHARCCPEKTGAELALDIITYTDAAEDAAVALIEARAARSIG